MGEFKGTPGPWRWDDIPTGDIDFSNRAPWLVNLDDEPVIRGEVMVAIDEDANLISAAPDLLDALIACDEAMAYMSEYDIPLTLPDKVKAAIAKALGQS